MKLFLSTILGLFLCFSATAQQQQWNRFVTTPDGVQLNGNVLTNVVASSVTNVNGGVLTSNLTVNGVSSFANGVTFFGPVNADSGYEGDGSELFNLPANELVGVVSYGNLPTGVITNFYTLPMTNQSAGGIVANQFSGPLLGPVVGNVTGNVAGNVVGNSTYATNAQTAATASLATNSITSSNSITANALSGSSFVNITNWGAKVDGVVYNNTYATNSGGANGTINVYDPNGRFTAAMKGLYCWMRFAGTNGLQDFLSGISNVASANVLQLSNATPYSTTNLPICIGHDDSPAWQNAFNYYGSNYQSVTFFVPLNPAVTNQYGISMICTNFQDTGDWRSHWNAQLHAPNMAVNGGNRCPVWTFQGDSPWVGGSVLEYNGTWQPTGSTILCCQPWGPNGTNVCNNFNFCSQTGGAQTQFAQRLYGFNGVSVYVKNISIQGSYNDNCWLWNCFGAETAGGEDSYIWGGFSQMDLSSIPVPNNTNTAGIMCPEQDNEPKDIWTGMSVDYFYTSIFSGENMDWRNLNILGATNCFDFMNAGGNLMCIEGVNNFQGVKNVFTDCNYGFSLDAQGINVQNSSVWNTNWCLINDPSSSVNGRIVFYSSAVPDNNSTNNGVVIGANNVLVQRAISVHSPVLNDGSFAVGSSIGGGFPQRNAPKFFNFSFYNYSAGMNDTAGNFMAVGAQSSGQSQLYLGGINFNPPWGFGSGTHGVNYVIFCTAPDDSSAPVLRGYVDQGGNLIWNGGDASGFGNGIFTKKITGATIETIGTHTPGQVTVGASAFTFINPHSFNLECYTSDSAAYTVAKNGVTISASVVGDGHWILQTNCTLTLTYLSTAPTLYTNAW